MLFVDVMWNIVEDCECYVDHCGGMWMFCGCYVEHCGGMWMVCGEITTYSVIGNIMH